MLAVKIQVLRGSIYKINGTDDIERLAELFADGVHPSNYPGRDGQAISIVKKLAGYPDVAVALNGYESYRLYDARIPATREYLAEVSTKVIRLFEDFNREFTPPEVLEDGTYQFASSGYSLERL